MVELLLSFGADPMKPNESGWTPLHQAAEEGLDEIVEILLRRGAEINAQDQNGETPLVRACYLGHERVVELLLAAKANVTNVGIGLIYTIIQKGHFNIMDMLLAAGVDVNVRTGGNNTALLLCVATVKGIEKLLAAGADLSATNLEGFTALLTASKDGHEDIVSLLLAAGGDVAGMDLSTITPGGHR
jgi:ankyrin repeat protein